MSSNQEDRDTDGAAIGAGTQNNINLVRTGVWVAAILIAILYSRSCFAAPPAAAPLAEVAQAVEFDAPTIASVNVSDDTAEFNGRGEPGETVELFVNGNRVGRTLVGSNGQWSYAAAGLGAGAYQVVASHQGRAFDQSERMSFTIEDATPQIELVKPEFDRWLANSSFAAGRDLILTGTGTPNGRHILFVNGIETASALAKDNGDWLFVLPEAAEGDYDLQVVSVGNGDDQESSDILNLALAFPDTTDAAVEVETESEEEVVAAPEYSLNIIDAVAGETSSSAVTISGDGSPGETVALYIDGAFAGSQVIGADGTWSFNNILFDRVYSIEAALFANGDGDTSGEAVAMAGPLEFDLSTDQSTTSTTGDDAAAFRLTFGSGSGDTADGGTSDGTGEDGDLGALTGAPAVELIVDASWSMTFPLDSNAEEDRLTADNPDSRIAIAQTAMVNLIENTLPEGVPVAVRAFGNIEGNLSCRTDLMSTLQPLDRESLAATVAGITPQFNANTAIAAALSQVSNDLAGTDREKIVVLLTDGQETCGGDPAAVIEQLAAEGTQVSLNVIGFAILDDELKEQFAQWAELGNGQFYDASDADLLNTALEGAMTVGYIVTDAEGNFVARGVVGGQYIDLEPGVYNISNSSGDIIYENVFIAPGSIAELSGG
ncbi:MAG: VWA domain-containing protein [Anaerolineae bacterium]